MSNATTTLVRLTNVSFGYENRPVIENVSLEIHEGEFIGLIGPNGAGKSTLFKGLLGLLPPLSGNVVHAPTIDGRIGYVPQRDQLDSIYPLTARDVVRMGPVGSLPWYRFPAKQENRQIHACLHQVGMSVYGNRPFSALSGGQRQRVLIARALAIDPVVLVLDEPTAGIDPVAEASILDLLTELNQNRRLTVLMVSHHILSLRSRVQRAILVKNHKVISGPAAELLDPVKVTALLDDSI